MRLKEKPDSMRMKQAAAAVGQCTNMFLYDKFFGYYDKTVAQILLNAEDITQEEKKENLTNTFDALLEHGVIPIVNENDTVATAEIALGDNDTLGAVAAVNARADLLVLMSDIEGLYTADPRHDPSARLIPEVRELTPELLALAGDAGSEMGTGGMVTKLRAAGMCMEAGCDMIITNGQRPQDLYRIAAGESVGTRFYGKRR